MSFTFYVVQMHGTGEPLLKYGQVNDSLHYAATTPKQQRRELLLSGNELWEVILLSEVERPTKQNM